jgi:DNA-binding NarL/FixJ family response regulator
MIRLRVEFVTNQAAAQAQELVRPLDRLTRREREVLAGMADGRTNADIAVTLGISHAAVAKHIGSIFTKLNLSSRDGHRRVLAVLTYLRG